MADPQTLGDYDPELVTLTLTAIKAEKEIIPQQFGAESRITIDGLARSETGEGMGGSAVVSRLHSTITPFGFTLMATDPAVKQISDLIDQGEFFLLSIVDNSATDSSVTGKCWVQTGTGWNRGRVAEEVVFTFTAQIPRDGLRLGQTALIG